MRENEDSIIEVSPCEALVINDASEIGAIESHPNPVPQQDTLAADQIPHSIPEAQVKRDYILIGPGKEVNLQDIDHWSVFTENLKIHNSRSPSPSVVLLHCGCLSLIPFIEISIRNNSSSSDVLNIQASISISPKFESK